MKTFLIFLFFTVASFNLFSQDMILQTLNFPSDAFHHATDNNKEKEECYPRIRIYYEYFKCECGPSNTPVKYEYKDISHFETKGAELIIHQKSSSKGYLFFSSEAEASAFYNEIKEVLDDLSGSN